PERKDGRPFGADQESFAVGPNVLEKQISKGDVATLRMRRSRGLETRMKGAFVFIIRAAGLELYQMEGQPNACRLGLEERATDSMDADPVIAFGDGRDEPSRTIGGIGGKSLKREGAILAPTPAEQYGMHAGISQEMAMTFRSMAVAGLIAG